MLLTEEDAEVVVIPPPKAAPLIPALTVFPLRVELVTTIASLKV
ncbi:MAG: hypothetical protein ACJAUR_002066 [Ulvibacter sp.]